MATKIPNNMGQTQGLHPQLRDALFEMYREKKLGRNQLCNACKQSVNSKELSGPISFWHVGDQFGTDKLSVLFAGKTARGNVDKPQTDGITDATTFSQWAIRNSAWPYWRYTKSIIENIYPGFEEGWRKIAFTNIVKCNSSSTIDTTNSTLKRNCLCGLGVFPAEVMIVKPKHIVLYLNRGFDDFLGEEVFGGKWEEITSRNYTQTCGKKRLPWWHCQIFMESGGICNVLRTGHPERKNKRDFVALVSDWIKTTADG